MIRNHGHTSSPFIDNAGVHPGAIRCTGARPPVLLPGVLDHREFRRVRTDLGRCGVCGEGRAVFRSADGHVVLCERCYAGLVREGNMKGRRSSG
ncbi:hypothetical protein J2129_000574 [Methanofollis sp. W23]|nr:hypothetical protein [Methanofollis sp. W23]